MKQAILKNQILSILLPSFFAVLSLIIAGYSLLFVYFAHVNLGLKYPSLSGFGMFIYIAFVGSLLLSILNRFFLTQKPFKLSIMIFINISLIVLFILLIMYFISTLPLQAIDQTSP